MPLPPSTAERELLHTRTITCQGFLRKDGLWDIEGWMTDVKSYSFPNRDRGEIKAGEPLHSLGLRLTIDDTMTIREAVAVTDFSPFRICPNITPNFSRLVGLRMSTGFTRAARELLGGTEGCTHLVDLLGPMGTTAFQTMVGRRFATMKEEQRAGMRKAPIIDTCHAWASDGPIVQREFPEFYTGDKT